MAYKAICFDVDGTLYDNSIMNRRILRCWLLHPILGMRFRKERKAFRSMQHTFSQEIPLRWREAMIISRSSAVEPSEPFDQSLYSKTYRKMDRCLYSPMRRMYRHTPALDGVRETFQKIHDNGLKIGVFSDFPLFEKLEGLGVSDLVDFASSSDDCGFLKPDTHCFEYLLYNLGMEPKDILYVGDSYEKDIVGASRAGIDGVLVNTGSKGDDPSCYPLAKAVFRDWAGFASWLSTKMGDV